MLLAYQRRYSFVKFQTRSLFGVGVDKISLMILICMCSFEFSNLYTLKDNRGFMTNVGGLLV